ncbi:thioesterase family protein [Paraferrimonas sp. SM1919]|uniref:thioesterase family protein n=1 Tax=Paraferrimonas sp. SM1919 TaxID=2662263 RepID=UPI0013D5EF37|nr:thioesterase family protein [Paraferrimonas sp. SM1919]
MKSSIDQHLAQVTADAQQTIKIDKSWGQGRTIFGGIGAAIAVQTMDNQIDDERLLRSLNVNYIGPLEGDKDINLSCEKLRQGKNVSQFLVTLKQEGKTALVAQGCYGLDRKSKYVLTNTDEHNQAKPDRKMFIPPIPKIVPKFLQHFDLSLQKGKFFNNPEQPIELHGWCRFKKKPEKISNAHLVALFDCWPPTLLQLVKLPAPANTMSWNIEFIHPSHQGYENNWFAFQAVADHFHNGYGTESSKIWDKQGRLIAVAQQHVTLFA